MSWFDARGKKQSKINKNVKKRRHTKCGRTSSIHW
jgi:hypothetical protein